MPSGGVKKPSHTTRQPSTPSGQAHKALAMTHVMDTARGVFPLLSEFVCY